MKIKNDDNSLKNRIRTKVNNLFEINKKECLECMRKKIISECEYIGFKNDRLHYRCNECRKRCTKSKNGLIKTFSCIYKFCNGDLNKFALSLGKGVYPYEYMESWERFDETSLPNKEAIYRKLNLEDVTDKGYQHAQKYGKYSELKILTSIMTYMFKVIHYCRCI